MSVALVDSTLEGDDIAVLLYRIEVSKDGVRDTIRAMRTTSRPGVNGDGKVHFFAYLSSSNIVDGAAIYDPSTRKARLFRAPAPINFDGQQASISPNACYFAYVEYDAVAAASFGVLATWPDNKVILRTPQEPHYRDEVEYNAVRWIDPNHVEFAYRSGRAKDLWIHAEVTVDTRTIRIDSLSKYPVWHP